VQFIIASSSALVLNDAKRQHLSTINTNSDLSFTTIQKQTYRRKQLWISQTTTRSRHYWRKEIK